MRRAVLISLCALWPLIAAAYGPETHRQMSLFAIDTSMISQESLFKDWGIVGSASTIAVLSSDGRQFLIRDLMGQGAVDEDNGIQPRNHFFDPINQAPLTVCLVAWGKTSPDWTVPGIGQGTPNFSFAQGRKSELMAFTASTKPNRDLNFAMMFETLGHVIHNIEDMAQPQHVRNDQHLEGPVLNYLPGVSNPSRYENYTEQVVDSLPFGGYQNVMLKSPTDYWQNAQGTGLAQFTNANFVSQGTNFRISNGIVVSNAKYRFPAPSDNTPDTIENALANAGICPDPNNPTVASDDQRCSLRGQVLFISNAIADNLTSQQDVNDRAAFYSIWNQDLQRRAPFEATASLCDVSFTFGGLFTVNELTFPYALGFLVPRAVGYSAGMIDYFFRGKIDLVPHVLADDGTAPTFDFVNLGDEVLTGDVQLYYDDANGTRYPVTGTGWPITVINLAPGASVSAPTIAIHNSPDPATPGVYMMVFSGTMGAEEPIGDGPGAVVAKQVTLPMPKIYFSAWDVTVNITEGSDVPPGRYGYVVLSFAMPPVPSQPGTYLYDSFFFNNDVASHVKLNGQDYPPPASSAPPFVSTCTPYGMAPIIPNIEGPGGGTPDKTRTWNWSYSTKNWVSWDEGTNLFGNSNQFQVIHERIPNALPTCATNLSLFFVNPEQSMSVEYLIGTQSIFKFCIRIDPTGIALTGGSVDGISGTAYISRMRGVGLMDGAAGIFKDPNPTSCPGS